MNNRSGIGGYGKRVSILVRNLETLPIGDEKVEARRLKSIGSIWRYYRDRPDKRKELCAVSGVTFPEIEQAVRKAHERWTTAKQAPENRFEVKAADIHTRVNIRDKRDSRRKFYKPPEHIL